MKRLATVLVVGFVLLMAVPASALDWGVGGFGGVSIPIEQDDAENGLVYGARVRLGLGMGLALEPQFFYLKNGEYDIEVGSTTTETLESWKATSGGVNLVLGAPADKFAGLRPFFFGGVRYNALDFEGHDTESEVGFGGGIGLEIGFRQVALDVRATGEIFPDGDASRKNGMLAGGLTVYLGP